MISIFGATNAKLAFEDEISQYLNCISILVSCPASNADFSTRDFTRASYKFFRSIFNSSGDLLLFEKQVSIPHNHLLLASFITEMSFAYSRSKAFFHAASVFEVLLSKSLKSEAISTLVTVDVFIIHVVHVLTLVFTTIDPEELLQVAVTTIDSFTYLNVFEIGS